jgi:uncharacterized protein YwqG
MTNFLLPPALEPLRARLLTTQIDFVRARAAVNPHLKPWQSKVGGLPYWPKGQAWPTSPDGLELFFLAQINFSEIPALTPFPSSGLVQFFINNDDLYGMDFDDGEVQDTFRVLFYDNPSTEMSQLQSKIDLERDYDCLPHRPEESYQLTFSLEQEVVPVTDVKFGQVFGGDFWQQFGEQEWQLMEDFGKKVRSDGHKLGGYAYFTQDDPRLSHDPMLLLLQLDSDELMDLMWGDMGVGHFFIRESDLLRRDFSRVLYDWDCL